MSAFDYAELFRHRGHKIVCVSYGQYNDPDNVAVECETCSEVLLSYDRPAYPDKHRSGAIRDVCTCAAIKTRMKQGVGHRKDCPEAKK